MISNINSSRFARTISKSTCSKSTGARLLFAFILVGAGLETGCGCGGQVSPVVDAADDGEAGAFEDGAVEAGADGDLDGGSESCGTLRCCPTEVLPTVDDVGLITSRARAVSFSPDIARGTTTLNVTWMGSTDDAAVTDMEFLTDSGPLHIALPVVAVPPVEVGQALELAIIRPILFSLTIEAQDDRIILHDGLTGELLAVYISQTANGMSAVERLGLDEDGLSVSTGVRCQGPEQGGCNYQTELHDLWFSAGGGEPTILGQGQEGLLVRGAETFRVMNRQSFDNMGEAVGKGWCGIPAGVRSFDIVSVR